MVLGFYFLEKIDFYLKLPKSHFCLFAERDSFRLNLGFLMFLFQEKPTLTADMRKGKLNNAISPPPTPSMLFIIRKLVM